MGWYLKNHKYSTCGADHPNHNHPTNFGNFTKQNTKQLDPSKSNFKCVMMMNPFSIRISPSLLLFSSSTIINASRNSRTFAFSTGISTRQRNRVSVQSTTYLPFSSQSQQPQPQPNHPYSSRGFTSSETAVKKIPSSSYPIPIQSHASRILQFQRITTHTSTTRQFGTKRPIDDNTQIIPGSIQIYDEQTSIPNIDIPKLERTISIIRSIIGYETYDVNLLLVNDEYMKETNAESRGIDKPTDILSFPFHDTEKGGAKGAGLLEEPEFDIPDYYTLGDMIVDVPYVMRRCEEDRIYYESSDEDGNSYKEHIDGSDDEEEDEYDDYVGDDDRGVSGAMANIYNAEERIHLLLVHGMLHLVGYDHIEDDDYEVMVSKEEEVLKILQSELEKEE